MKIGFVGLGMMGGGMSLNIRRAGYDMIVHDIRQESAERQIEMGLGQSDRPDDGADMLLAPGTRPVGMNDQGLVQGAAQRPARIE